MIGLLSISRITTCVAVTYAGIILLCVAGTLHFGDRPWSTWTSLSYAFSGATVLQLVLMGLLYFGWKCFWRYIPILSRILYPDISGTWDIEIKWQSPDDSGVVQAKATIRQNFVRVSMEVTSSGSESQTLIAQPKKDPESGTALLYYVYMVVPKAIGEDLSRPYFGAATLKFSEAKGGELSGNYWTSIQTTGHFRLFNQKQ